MRVIFLIWYSSPQEQILRELNADLNMGLAEKDANERLKTYGYNKLNEKPPRSFLRRFLDQMKDVMVIILMIAAAISLGVKKCWISPNKSGIQSTGLISLKKC